MARAHSLARRANDKRTFAAVMGLSYAGLFDRTLATNPRAVVTENRGRRHMLHARYGKDGGDRSASTHSGRTCQAIAMTCAYAPPASISPPVPVRSMTLPGEARARGRT